MFTPINFDAVHETVNQLPRRVQATCYIVLTHLLSQARRIPGIHQGLMLYRGDVSTIRRDIPEKIPVSEQEFRTTLSHLEKVGFLTQKLTRPNLVLSICDFDTYVNDNKKSNPESNPEVTQDQPRSNPPILEKVVNDKRKKKEPYVSNPESEAALAIWEEGRPLPNGIDRTTYLKVLDDLHRIDKVPWDSVDGIYEICRWAVTVWESKHIQSPSKLRKPSRTYPELKQWQVIQGQIRDKGASSNGHDSEQVVRPSWAELALQQQAEALRREAEEERIRANQPNLTLKGI